MKCCSAALPHVHASDGGWMAESRVVLLVSSFCRSIDRAPRKCSPHTLPVWHTDVTPCNQPRPLGPNYHPSPARQQKRSAGAGYCYFRLRVRDRVALPLRLRVAAAVLVRVASGGAYVH